MKTPLEEKVRAEWDADMTLRSQFRSFDAYAAYRVQAAAQAAEAREALADRKRLLCENAAAIESARAFTARCRREWDAAAPATKAKFAHRFDAYVAWRGRDPDAWK